MDVDARLAVGVLGHHAWKKRHAEKVERVGHAVHEERTHARIAHHDLELALRGGVAFERRAHIKLEARSDRGDLREERSGAPTVVGNARSDARCAGEILERMHDLPREGVALRASSAQRREHEGTQRLGRLDELALARGRRR